MGNYNLTAFTKEEHNKLLTIQDGAVKNESIEEYSLRTSIPDPAKPAEGTTISWVSDGTGIFNKGDFIVACTISGVTKYKILFIYSSGTTW